MSGLDFSSEPKAGDRLGCLLVLLPFLAFVAVMQDALHVWGQPLANPLLWLAAAVTLWLGARLLINKPVAALARGPRLMVWTLLIAVSAGLAVLIVRSV